jgi:hypothetical protein
MIFRFLERGTRGEDFSHRYFSTEIVGTDDCIVRPYAKKKRP